jgi:hypothetical protein
MEDFLKRITTIKEPSFLAITVGVIIFVITATKLPADKLVGFSLVVWTGIVFCIVGLVRLIFKSPNLTQEDKIENSMAVQRSSTYGLVQTGHFEPAFINRFFFDAIAQAMKTNTGNQRHIIRIDLSAHSLWRTFMPERFNTDRPFKQQVEDALVELDFQGGLWKACHAHNVYSNRNIELYFRILVIDPHSLQASRVFNSQRQTEEQYAGALRNANEDVYYTLFVIWKLKQKFQHWEFNIRILRNDIMSYSQYRVENNILTGPYLYTGLIDSTPCSWYCSEPGGHYSHYINDFDRFFDGEHARYTVDIDTNKVPNNIAAFEGFKERINNLLQSAQYI